MVFYFVQRGETLYAIARRYQTTVHAIVAANRLEDPNAITPGQALIIPRPGEVPSPPPGGIVHVVRPGETIFHLAGKFRSTPHDILRANQIAHPEFILPGQQLVIPEPAEVGEDWPMFGRTPARAGISPVELTGTPLPGWSYTPRRRQGVRPSAPIIRYERIYAGLGDGYYYSFDRSSGRVKWRILGGEEAALSALGEYPMAAPAAVEGLVYLGAPDGVVYAVDAYTGHHIWRMGTDAPITSSPAVSGGVVYLGGWDESLYALEAKTGAIAWKIHVGAPVRHAMAVGDEFAYAVTEAGELWAVDAHSGQTTWRAPATPGVAPVYAEVAVMAGGTAFDPSDGTILWQAETGGETPVAWLDQVIFPSAALDLFTGAPRSPSSSALAIRHLAAAGGHLLGIGSDGRLHIHSADDGEVVWTIDLEGESEQPPAVAAGQIAVALQSGILRTFRLKPDRAQSDRTGSPGG